MTTRIRNLVVAPFVGWAIWLNVTEPMIGRPSGLPALVSDQAATRLAPSGFEQAQRRPLVGESLRLYEIDCANREPWTDCAIKLPEKGCGA